MTNPFEQIDFQALLSTENLISVAEALLIALGGFLILRIVVFIVRRIVRKRATARSVKLITRTISWIGLGLIFSVVLLRLGVNLLPILGAAGIVGIAIGIASQASLSNIISGLFLVSEKPFAVGDVIKVGETVGILYSIDLLSVKLRTFDNLLVRIPNEKIATAELTNITRFPIRRMDFKFTLPFSVEPDRAFVLLREVAQQSKLVLQEPAPILLPRDFLDYGWSVLFGVWFQKSDFLAVKSEIFADILRVFKENDISFAMPRQAINPGERPISIEMVSPS
ncbi:MAG: mechanosensitive ion channel family protein [Spirochaetales bacterium]